MASRTHTPRVIQKTVQRRTFLVDADGFVLGRLAAMACHLLRGKGKAFFSPYQDIGDTVIVINAAKIRLTGNKLVQKFDFRASGYPGGQVYTPYSRLIQEKPDRAIRLAVYGMLPKNRLRDRFIKRLKIYKDDKGRQVFPGAEVIDMKNSKIRSGGPFMPAPAAAKPAEAAKA